MTALLPALLAEHQPQTTLERHLTQQLAHILAKQATAEDNETHLLAKQPQYLLAHRPDGHLVPDPAYLLYNNRLDALRLHQARLGREQSRILRELHRLKRTPLAMKAASEPGAANQNRASEPSAAVGGTANEPTPPASPRLDRGVNGQGANAAHPDPWMARSSRAKAEVGRGVDTANEPKGGQFPGSEPRQQPGLRANEPKKPHVSPVLDEATADRIEAMIASGDIGQLEEAARLLGILDGTAPPPPGFVELVKSKLVG